MKIFVDADACPKPIKQILFRLADRAKIEIIFVANRALHLPRSPTLKSILVQSGFDEADHYILQHSQANDLIITADLPLAAELIKRGAHAINPRGEFYTKDNVRERLNLRDFACTLRASGIKTGGPPALSKQDRMNFANSLDRYIRRNLNA